MIQKSSQNELKNVQAEKGPSICHEAEGGFITIIVVILMLGLLTIIGVSAINMSTVESMIVRSDGQIKRNFYMAESGAYEATQRLESAATTETNPTGGVAWVVPTTTDMTIWSNWLDNNGTANDFSDDSWTANSTRPETFFTTDTVNNPANLDVLMPGTHTSDNVRLSAHFQGVAPGSSLKVTGAAGRLYAFSVFGMYSELATNQGEALIEMGYRKRF
ncbi:pilus assembly PilX family protein [Desulforhopalus sp. 52FAK]